MNVAQLREALASLPPSLPDDLDVFIVDDGSLRPLAILQSKRGVKSMALTPDQD